MKRKSVDYAGRNRHRRSDSGPTPAKVRSRQRVPHYATPCNTGTDSSSLRVRVGCSTLALCSFIFEYYQIRFCRSRKKRNSGKPAANATNHETTTQTIKLRLPNVRPSAKSRTLKAAKAIKRSKSSDAVTAL